MKNVIRRFDSIAISRKESATTADADGLHRIIKATKALRMDDTPPVGSLGGQQPKALYVPKVKPPKKKRRKPAPGLMRIFDNQGREWGRRKWKELPSTTNTKENAASI
jgi:hypothetical protein